MDKLRFMVFGIALGFILGAAIVPTRTIGAGAARLSGDGTAWTELHRAITAPADEEHAPTF